MEKWSSIIDSNNYIQCLEGREKMAKGKTLCMQNGNCFFLPGSSFVSAQSLSHTIVTPCTLRLWPPAAKYCTHILCGKLSLPLEVFVPRTRIENSCWCLNSRKAKLGDEAAVTPYCLREFWCSENCPYITSPDSSPHFSQWGCQVHNSFLPSVKEWKNSILFLYPMLSPFLFSIFD